MGGSVSKPQKLGRNQLLALTQKPRDFIDRMFQVMLKDITKEDYLSLANPRLCGNFVFVMADALQQTFHSLKLAPTKDEKSGLLYFVKRDDIMEKRPEETYYHCLSLAYFYIRIFQIFGALAITVVDHPVSSDMSQYFQSRPVYNKTAVLGAPGQAPISFGGARQVLNIDWLRKYVGAPKQSLSRIDYDFTKVSGLTLIRADGNTYIQYTYSSSDEPLIAKIVKSAKVSKQNLERETYTVGLLFTFRKELEFNVVKDVSDYVARSKFGFDTIQPIDMWLEELFKRLLEQYKEKSIESKGAFTKQDGLLNKNSNSNSRSNKKPGVKKNVFTSTVGAINPLDTSYLKQSIGDSKTIPFCVARAFQLINSDVIDSIAPPEVTSRICQTTFAQGRIAIPVSDRSLDSTPGFKSMDQLWYTNAYTRQSQDGKYVTKVEVPQNDSVQYKTFLADLNEMFGDTTKDSSKFTSLKDVTFRKPNCGDKLNKDLRLKQDPRKINPQGVIPHIQQTVQTLFTIQEKHTREVEQFIRTYLFEIKSGPNGTASVRLQPNLLKGGIPYVNTVAKSARELLMGYYSRCEKTYSYGLDEIIQQGSTF
jgi:hypothetical protein